jgi:uncharacterized protein YndB with AHSA1/START domain
MNGKAEDAVVRKSVHVQAPIGRAFSVFVEQMDTWWPPSHHAAKTPFEAIVVEPREGGKWYEQDAAGERSVWGTVLNWDPPHRVVFAWHLTLDPDRPDWIFDPDMSKASEVELRFTAGPQGTTLVELTHSKLERHGETYEQLRRLFEGPDAWQGILELFATIFESGMATA